MATPLTKPLDWKKGFAGQNPDSVDNKNYKRSIMYYFALYSAWPEWCATCPKIRKIYKECISRREKGEDVQVDHIVPIISELVCGLHVHWNLEIIPAGPNMSKSNRWWPDMPFEQEDMFK